MNGFPRASIRPFPVIVRATSLILLVFVAACSQEVSGETEAPAGIRTEMESAAKKVVDQNEDWADRAEFKSYRAGDLWRVTAWRVDHPAAKGNDRFVPWGARTMVLDRNYRVLEYRSGAK